MLLLAGLVAFAFASLSNVEYATRVVVRTAACVAEETKAGKSTGASCLCVATDTRTHSHALFLGFCVVVARAGCALMDDVVRDVEHLWMQSREAGSGLATGRRQHAPIRMTTSSSGQLLAHEAAHIAQQKSGVPPPPPGVSYVLFSECLLTR